MKARNKAPPAPLTPPRSRRRRTKGGTNNNHHWILIYAVAALFLTIMIAGNIWVWQFQPTTNRSNMHNNNKNGLIPTPPDFPEGPHRMEPEDAVPPKTHAEKENDFPDAELDQKHHLIFSTSCHFKQDWQSYVFFHSAMVQKQPGEVTRIVSGCSPQEEKELSAFHSEKIEIMSPTFNVHFTPDYGRKGGAEKQGGHWQLTKYWNKPFGVRHWLENKFGYSPDNMSTEHDDDIVILVDPDMLLQRPIINDFRDAPDITWIKHWRDHPDEIRHRVTHGYPISQIYAYGGKWRTSFATNLTHVVPPDSPVVHMTGGTAAKYFPAGPPYMLTMRDMYEVAYHWTIFTPKIFDIAPIMMSEMYGFSAASAHLDYKHQLAQGFMVSNAGMSTGEGWDFLTETDPADICDPTKTLKNMPLVIHFCQRYALGEFFLSKYKTHHEILSCDFPMLQEPPPNAAVLYDYSHYGNGDVHQWSSSETMEKYRNAFMVCRIMQALNGAATWYKDHHCNGHANYSKTWNFFVDEGDDLQKEERRQKKIAAKH